MRLVSGKCFLQESSDLCNIQYTVTTVLYNISDYQTGDDSIKIAYSLTINQGQAQSRDLQVLLVGAENTGKTCLVVSFLGDKFAEGQTATEGTDVDQ